MANSARHTINYKPRVSEQEAYERLPLTLKRAMQEAVTEWCSRSILKYFEKHGLAKTIDELHRWDEHFMNQKLQSERFKKADIVSTFRACKVTPLRVYGITRNTRLNMEQK